MIKYPIRYPVVDDQSLKIQARMIVHGASKKDVKAIHSVFFTPAQNETQNYVDVLQRGLFECVKGMKKNSPQAAAFSACMLVNLYYLNLNSVCAETQWAENSLPCHQIKGTFNFPNLPNLSAAVTISYSTN